MQTDYTTLALDVRAQDYDRFLCIQLAPSALRPALYAVTAFHGELARIAETVSEPLLGHIRLAWWREAVEEILGGSAPRNHPVMLALTALYPAYPELFTTLLQTIEVRAADLDVTLLATEEDWRSYLDHTAGSLHYAWALLLDAAQAIEQRTVVYEQARAYAMVGLVRAIPHLRTHGLTRFPAAWLEEGELSAARIQALVKVAETQKTTRLPKALLPLRGLMSLAQHHARYLRQHTCATQHSRGSNLALVLRILKMKFFLC